MKNMRIGARLLLGFGTMVLLAIGMGVYDLSQGARLREFSAQMDSRDFRILDTLRRIAKSEEEMRATRAGVLASYLLRKDRLRDEDPRTAQQEWEQSKEHNLALLNELEVSTAEFANSDFSLRRAEYWRKISLAAHESQDALKALVPEVHAQFDLINRGDLPQMLARMPALEMLREAFDNKVEAAERATEQQIQAGRAEAGVFYDNTRASIALSIVATALLGVILSLVIQRSITVPLTGFMQFTERVGKGDLTEQAPVARRDELGDLARSLNQMTTGLKAVAGQTWSVAENLNAATAEILAATQQQAAGTAQQAAAVQQASATMAELSQSGAQISERARQVAAASEATSSASAAGLQSVQNTTATMESIREQAEVVAENVIALSERTQAIGEIIATVNDIAEQSHLLALNAAIEAAAAGEHGRSFAVVAGEMKNLADQSKQATLQVRSILGDIQKAITGSVMMTEEAVKRVESGKQQADVADRTIRELTGNIQQSVQAFQQIVAGANQQQIGFEQVTQAFRSIGLASQQTATSTRQSEKAAANLNALAQQLRGAVEKYRI